MEYKEEKNEKGNIKPIMKQLGSPMLNFKVFCNSPSPPLADIVLFGLSFSEGRGFHTLINNARSPPQSIWDLTIHHPSGSSVLVGTRSSLQWTWNL